MVYFFEKMCNFMEDFMLKHGVGLCLRAFIVVIILTLVICHFMQLAPRDKYFIETNYIIEKTK